MQFLSDTYNSRYGLSKYGLNTYLSRDNQVTACSQESRYGLAKHGFNTEFNRNSSVTAGSQEYIY